MPVQQNRLMERLETLGQIGATAEGGVTRLAFTPEYRQAEQLVRGWMETAGLHTRIDPAGNLIGRREGKHPEQPCLMLGSHIDSITDGGRYDGVLGVLTALEVAQVLAEDGVALAAPLEVVAFMDEEGPRWGSGLFGSRAMIGELPPNELQRRDHNHITRAEAMQAWGLDPDRIHEAMREPDEIGAYLELHIEQGAVLESQDQPVGGVTAIAGPLFMTTRLHGQADHAGATPMGELRRDTLLGAAELALSAEKIAKDTSSTCVVTVGRLEVKPGVTNIIPGEVFMTFDIRDIDEVARDQAEASIRSEIEQVCRQRRLTAEIDEFMRIKPVKLSPAVVETVAAACTQVGLPAFQMPSGAGHDAQLMAKLTDVGMIFVRCRNGVSHSPAEYVAPADVFLGARVMYEAALGLQNVVA